MSEITYTVKGMHCQSCVANVTEAVSELAGVAAVDVTLDDDRVVVRGDSLDDDVIRATIVAAGYVPA